MTPPAVIAAGNYRIEEAKELKTILRLKKNFDERSVELETHLTESQDVRGEITIGKDMLLRQIDMIEDVERTWYNRRKNYPSEQTKKMRMVGLNEQKQYMRRMAFTDRERSIILETLKACEYGGGSYDKPLFEGDLEKQCELKRLIREMEEALE